MMDRKRVQDILWGIVLVAIGVLIGLNAAGLLPFELFFDGWWTLFILVPSTIALLTDRNKSGALVGIGVGVVFLLDAQDVIPDGLWWKLLLPVGIVLVGLKLVVGGIVHRRSAELMSPDATVTRKQMVFFSGAELNYDGQVFEGAELNTAFGGIECDLRGAIIEKDCIVRASAVFGGVDILVPPHVRVEVKSSCLFGGVDNKVRKSDGSPTLTVVASCAFGGVDIR